MKHIKHNEMDNLIKKLQDEVGLSEEEALKTLSVVKEYMDKEGLDIDWEKFFKGKYSDFKDKVKSLYDSYTQHAEDYSYKIADKVEDLATQAKRTARDLTNKASHLLKDEE